MGNTNRLNNLPKEEFLLWLVIMLASLTVAAGIYLVLR